MIWGLALLLILFILFLAINRSEENDKYSDPLSSKGGGHESSGFEQNVMNKRYMNQVNKINKKAQIKNTQKKKS